VQQRRCGALGGESWITRLRTRAVAVRERAKLLEVALDEELLRTVLLATSRANLEAERATRRRIYPDSDHAGLTSILERPRLSDEDLIILISASPSVARQSGWEHSDNQDGHFGGRGERMIIAARR
jgi:primosomal replication protein N''